MRIIHTNPILIDIPMPIETPRLILRNILPGDGASMFEAKIETFEQLHKWMPWAKEPGIVEDAEIVARTAHAKFILREDIMIVGFEKDSGKPVVFTGLHRMNWELRIFEIGYWVRKSAQGKGYATESTNALVRYGFNALSATKLSICHATGNEESQHIIEKLGFEREGISKGDARLPSGAIVDHYWYARFDDKNLPDLSVSWG